MNDGDGPWNADGSINVYRDEDFRISDGKRYEDLSIEEIESMSGGDWASRRLLSVWKPRADLVRTK